MPTTANFMAKLCHGKAEDLASTVILASNKDILLVPAMNVRMWEHKATQNNVRILKDYGYLFIGPERGEMAVENMVKVRCLVLDKFIHMLKVILTEEICIKKGV